MKCPKCEAISAFAENMMVIDMEEEYVIIQCEFCSYEWRYEKEVPSTTKASTLKEEE